MGCRPTFSIILPAYNVEEYIATAIESVLTQSYKDFELIVIDDGSTDGTLAAVRQTCEGDCRCIVLHTHNRGVSAARNLGLDVCAGEYLYFLDGDDSLPPHALANIARSMMFEEPDVIVTTVAVSNGRFPEFDSYIEVPNFDPSSLAKYGPVSSGYPTYLFLFVIAHKLIDDVRFDESLSVQEDSVFLLRALEGAEKYSRCDEPTYIYRKVRKGSALDSLGIEGCLSIKEARKRVLLSTDDKAPGYNADVEFGSACFGVLRRVSRDRERYLNEARLESDVLARIEGDTHLKTRFVCAASRHPLLLRPIFIMLGAISK